MTLLTDFGLIDHYLGTMKGVLLRFAPDAQLVDISHEIPAQDVSRGAFELAMAVDYFPKGTVHLAVVDPGVGTSRRPIAIRGPKARFVGPDNGLFGQILIDAGAPETVGMLALPDGWKARIIDADRHRIGPLSATFHGRDLFAPVAGRLAAGLPFRHVGDRTDQLVDCQRPTYSTYVTAVDRFGNIITNRRAQPDSTVIIRLHDQQITSLTSTYGAGSGVIALIGSTGFVEIAIPGGNAADFLGIKVGDPIDALIAEAPASRTGERTIDD